MLFGGSVCSDTTVLFISLLIIVVIIAYKRFYQYWQRHNIPCLQQQFGSSQEHLGIKYQQVYNTIKQKGWNHAGVFLQFSPIYIAANLNLVKNIMTKDFEYFPHRGLYYNEKDPLSCHIFNTSGTKWKHMRTKLNQIFTSSKLKLMFPLILKCQASLLRKIDTEEGIDIKRVAESFISNVIESCAFGLDWENIEEESLFQQFGKRIFKRSLSRRVKGFIVENFPKLGKILNIALIPKDASDFFLKIVNEALSYRRRNKVVRHDFIQVLSEIKNEDELLTVEEIAAQCFIFFLAGMSTSPTAISFALYELSKNEEIQDRVRREICEVLKKYQEVSYEAIQEMKYLDQVLNETLRKYPPAAYLNRKCVKDYKIFDGDVVIKKNTTVVIPVLGIHNDESLYPDPEKFDPERFSEKNISSRDTFAFIPFGAGPRICIGMRFGQLQSKLALISLLERFKFTVNERTMEPFRMKPNMLVLTPEGGIWLNAKKI